MPQRARSASATGRRYGETPPTLADKGVTSDGGSAAPRPARKGRRAQVAGQLRLIALAAWRGVGELYNSDGLTHAASIAYYALLSLFPLFLLALTILGQVTADPAERDAVVRFVFRYFPRQSDFITGQLDAVLLTTHWAPSPVHEEGASLPFGDGIHCPVAPDWHQFWPIWRTSR